MTSERGIELLLAFDFGLSRVGVATANLHTRTASPLTTLAIGGGIPWPELDRIVAEWRPQHLVVGLPSSPASASLADTIREFASDLGRRYGLPVATVDEAFTSQAAKAELSAGRRSGFLRRRIRKGRIDRHAACLIAEQWMNRHS